MNGMRRVRGRTPGGGAVEVAHEAGRITGVTSVPEDPDEGYLTAGLVDLQVNGYAGLDVNGLEVTA